MEITQNLFSEQQQEILGVNESNSDGTGQCRRFNLSALAVA
jgi:hypothetical protein